MAGLVAAIHVVLAARKTWMPATSAGMTIASIHQHLLRADVVAGEQRLAAADAEHEALVARAFLELGLVVDGHRADHVVPVDVPAVLLAVLDGAELSLDGGEQRGELLLGRRFLELV